VCADKLRPGPTLGELRVCGKAIHKPNGAVNNSSTAGLGDVGGIRALCRYRCRASCPLNSYTAVGRVSGLLADVNVSVPLDTTGSPSPLHFQRLRATSRDLVGGFDQRCRAMRGELVAPGFFGPQKTAQFLRRRARTAASDWQSCGTDVIKILPRWP
jgi:hypothetical protein